MENILFDLDGTITDSFAGISNSVVYALKKYGIEVEDKRTLFPFIGPPLVDSFINFYGFSHDKALEAVNYYREYYSVKGIFENSVYEGVVPLLKNLKESGKNVILATCKPEKFAEKILEHLGLLKYFDTVAGATFDESRIKKEDVISYALSLGGITDKSSAIMIGDRKDDILGARGNCLKSIGVLYGYGNLEELTQAGADYIAEKPEDILKIVL